jgi:hypothetical protein
MREIEPVVHIYKVKEQPSEYNFWKAKSPEERLEAMELLRKQFYEYNYKTLPRFPRVCHITQQKQR